MDTCVEVYLTPLTEKSAGRGVRCADRRASSRLKGSSDVRGRAFSSEYSRGGSHACIIADLHDWRLGVESAPGEGATFHVNIPLLEG